MTSELWAILPGFQVSLSEGGERQTPTYQMSGSTAVVPIVGPTTKYGDGGTASTMLTRGLLREVAASPQLSLCCCLSIHLAGRSKERTILRWTLGTCHRTSRPSPMAAT